MVFELPQYWDAAIDGIQLVLCFLILVFLIRSRKKNRASAQETANRKSGHSFNEQIYNHTLKQEVDLAFANIAEAIAAEQRKLDRILPSGDAGKHQAEIAPYSTDLTSSVNPEISPIAGTASDHDPLHEQIQKLSDKGMSVHEISQELKTPQAEVELVLSLRSSLDGRTS